jgi:hypothetical protein
MALIQFIVEGFDPTILGAEDCITPAELLQMVHEAQPAAGIGAEVESDTAPDTTTYPVFKRFTWAKTSAGARTGEEYYWNGSAWTLKVPPAGSINGSSLMNGTVTLAKLTPSTAYYLMQMNAGGTAWTSVPVSSIFTTNLVPQNSIVNAAAADYIMYSGVGGVWSSVLFSTQLESTLAVIGVDIDIVKDTLGAGVVGQVVYESAADGSLGFSWVEDRLRANQTATSKINWGAANASKYPRVNSTGTDVDYVTAADITAVRVAILKATAAAGAAAQAIGSTGPVTIEFNAITPSSGSFATLSSNQVTLPAGSYLFDADIPIHGLQAAGTLVQVQLYNVTSSSVEATASATRTIDGDYSLINLKHYVAPVVSTTYLLRIYVNTAHATQDTLGLPVNLNSLGEVYSQVSILKLS